MLSIHLYYMQKHQKLIVYKVIALGLFIGSGYAIAPYYAIAQTTPVDRQALVAQLLAEVSALQQQLSAMSGTSAQSSANPSSFSGQTAAYQSDSCIVYRPLGRGATGADVSCLQRLLISKGLLSADSATGYFGALTEAAVKRFQRDAGIVSSGDPSTTGYGSFGPRTRSGLFGIQTSSGSFPTSGGQYPISGASSQPVYLRPNEHIGGIGCNFNGIIVAHGTSLTAYSSATVPSGSQCAAETRTCFSGTLSGTAASISCGVLPPVSCAFASTTIPHGTSIVAYGSATTPAGVMCAAEPRSCYNGVLSGSYPYSSCAVSYASCTLDGITLKHNESRSFHASSTVAYGSLCEAVANVQVRTCQNGTMFGTDTFNRASCSPSAAPATCTFASRMIPHASSTPAYDATCNTQTRQCTNGVLSGSYTNTSCPLRACTLDGVIVPHGQSRVFYHGGYIVWGLCYPQTRTCTDGTFSGDISYNKATCGGEGGEGV